MSRSIRLVRLIRKELYEILRDRRTIATLLLMPLLLYPLLGLAFAQVFASSAEALKAPVYRVGFMTLVEGQEFYKHASEGQNLLLAAGQLVDRSSSAQARLEMLPVEQDLLAKLETMEFKESASSEVERGSLDLAIRKGPRGDWELFFREDSATGREAFRYVRRLIEARDQGPPRPDALKLTPKPVTPEQTRQTSWLSVLVPLVLILMTITGAVYPAIDLTAGERERGTMEILAASPIPRFYLLLAKYVAVLTVALLTAVVNLVPMVIVLAVSGVARETFALRSVPQMLLTLSLIFGLMILFAAFFSAVLLALTSVARSFKEAQAYLIPLMLVALTPGMLSLLPGLQLDYVLSFVPLLNIVLLARDLLEGTANWTTGALVVGVTAVYALLALMLAARIFGREMVFFERRARRQDGSGEQIGPAVE